MVYQTENTLEKRLARVHTAREYKEPDRVPFCPRVNSVYAQDAGADFYEVYSDWRNFIPGIEKFLSKYEVDMYWNPAYYPIKVMEVLGTTAVKWPGADWNIPLDRGIQLVDGNYLEEDEYDEYIVDPSHFFMTKFYPRKHKNLAGLSKVTFRNVIEFSHYAGMAQWADSDVRQAFLTLFAAGDQAKKWIEAQGECAATALKYQAPHGCILGVNAPYDALADGIRGFTDTPMDLLEMPETVEAAIRIQEVIAMEYVDGLKAAGVEYCFMPLHGGTDDFMSEETYLKYYLPSLRRVIEYEQKCGITPYIFFEGKYNTRLDILRNEFPAGIVGMFEQVDIAEAKKKLYGHMTVCGNMPGAEITYGKPEKVIELTKKMIDDCAPGGGFLMDCSIVLDHYKPECMDAWYETTINYGVYK